MLKAIGLQRTGKQDEAYALAQEVAALEPTDDNSLQALTILYREMHRRKHFPLPLLSTMIYLLPEVCVTYSFVAHVLHPGFMSLGSESEVMPLINVFKSLVVSIKQGSLLRFLLLTLLCAC